MATKKKQPQPPQYVVGQKAEEFCWLLALQSDQHTDDQNIGEARRFDSLEEAEAAAARHNASVFEIIDEATYPATLEEV